MGKLLHEPEQFEARLFSLKYNHEEAISYKDPFHEIKNMMRMWNKNMDQYLNHGRITCLYESM